MGTGNLHLFQLYINKYQTDQSLFRLWGPFSVKAVRHIIVQSRNHALCIVLTSSAKGLPLQIILLHVVPTAACILTYRIYSQHSIWHLLCDTIWHLFWQSLSHFTWHPIWHSMWHIFCHLIWHSYLTYFVAAYQAIYLTWHFTNPGITRFASFWPVRPRNFHCKLLYFMWSPPGHVSSHIGNILIQCFKLMAYCATKNWRHMNIEYLENRRNLPSGGVMFLAMKQDRHQKGMPTVCVDTCGNTWSQRFALFPRNIVQERIGNCSFISCFPRWSAPKQRKNSKTAKKPIERMETATYQEFGRSPPKQRNAFKIAQKTSIGIAPSVM